MKLKRILALILCVCMVFSTMSFTVFAEETADDAVPAVILNAQTVSGHINVEPVKGDTISYVLERLEIASNLYALDGGLSEVQITLNEDIVEDEVIQLKYNTVINGYDNKITSSASRVIRVTDGNINVTLNDVNMVSEAVRVGTNDIRGISIDGSLTGVVLTLNDCSVDFTDESADDWSYAVNIAGNGNGHTININGGSYEGANVINVWGNDNVVSIDGATLTSIYAYNEMYTGVCVKISENSTATVSVSNTTFNGDYAVKEEDVSGNSMIEIDDTCIDNTKSGDNGSNTPAGPVATVDGVAYLDLQSAIDDAYTYDGNVTIKLLADYAGDVTITEKAGLYLTLDGNGKTFEGTITVDPLSDTNDNRCTTIKNVNFVTDEGIDFITSVKTNHYPRIAVKDCSFTGSGNDNTVAIRTKSPYGLIVEDCTGTGLHSFIQNTAGVGVSISGVEVADSKGGLSLGTAQNVSVNDCDVDVKGYGIRLDAAYNTDATLENNTVNAYIPVVVRKATATDYDLTFTGNDNSYTASNDDGKWCVIGETEYEEGAELPTVPVAGVDVECVEALAAGVCGYASLNGKEVVIPKGSVKVCYTGADTFWGEASANSENSFVIKLYEDDKMIASSSLNNIDGIIDGGVNVTWYIPFGGSNDQYWDVEWAEGYPKYDMNPTAVKLFSDGKEVATNGVQYNAPDDLNKIVAIAEDANGNVKAYTSLANAIAGSNRKINVVNNTSEEITDLNGCELTTTVANGVTVKSTSSSWIYTTGLNIGKGVTLDVDSICYDGGINTIEGAINAETLYNRDTSKIIVKNGGKIVTSGMIVNRYHEDADAGIYVYGDGDASTVEISCADTLGTYSGTFYVEDAVVNTKMMWIDYWKNNSGEGDEFARSTPKFVNSTVNVASEFRLYKDATLSLTNSKLTAGKVQVRENATPVVTADSYSSVTASSVENLSGASMNAVLGTNGAISFVSKFPGSGTEEDPYLISTADQLTAFKTNVNSGDTTYNAPGVWVALANDIDMAGIVWDTGIGDGHEYSFDGNFDGKNYTISNLNIKPYADASGYVCGGLFGYTYGGVEIKNLVLENISVIYTGEGESHNLGALVGFANNNGGKLNVSNVTVKGDIKIDAPNTYGVGAIVGYSYREMGTISDCKVIGNDGSYIKGYSFVGGITGYSYYNAKILNSSVENIDISATSYSVGGIAGLAQYGTNVKDCTVNGVDISGVANTGSIIGAIDTNGLVIVENLTTDSELSEVGGDYSTNKPVEARIGNTYYLTLEKAFNVAQAGDTVTLLADIAGEVEIPEGITLDANGYSYVSTGLKGSGTEADPYLINNKAELIWFRDNVDKQAADGSTQYAGKYIKLTADIDLAGENWNPIGSMSGDHGSFQGVFDGGNHTISNLYVEQAGDGIGLFARTAGNAVIKNLKLNNVTVKSTNNKNYVGGLVGNAYASTKIENVHVTGNVDISGRGYIGGIAGHGYVVMDNVSVIGEGTIKSSFWCAGGILGYAGEGITNIMNASVEGLTITSAAGGLGAIVGMAEDNGGTQPISGSNLSAKDVEIKTYVGGYGTAYENYAIGYLYGGNPTSNLTGTLVAEDVVITNASGKTPAEISDAAAKVGNTVYFDLASAFKAATSGCEITLLADVTISEKWDCRYNGAKFLVPVTINGNGKTIKLTGEVSDMNWNTVFRFEDVATVKDLTIDLSGATGAQRAISSKLSITVDNVTIIGNNTRYGIIFGESAGADISGVTATITNCEVTDCAKGVSDNANGQDAKAVTITGSTFTNASVVVSAGENVTFTDNTMDNGYVDIRAYTADAELSVVAKDNILDANAGNPNQILAKTIDAQAEFNTPVAYVGGKYYTTLAEAIEKAANDATIKLVVDLAIEDETFTIPAGKALTLDLNGKKITVKENKAEQNSRGNYELFYNLGNLTVTGNGSIELTAAVNRYWNAMSTIFHNRGGELTIENGTFTHKGGTDMAYVVDNSANYSPDATTNIEGGSLSSTYIAIRNRMDKHTSNGGGSGIVTLNVSGGEIYGYKRGIWGQASSTPCIGNIDITDGKVTSVEQGAVVVATNADSEIKTEISGGIFSSDVSDFLVDGASISKNNDGTYGVVSERIIEAVASEVEVVAGQEFTVAVKLAKGENIFNAEWTLAYDTSLFELKDAAVQTGSIKEIATKTLNGEIFAEGETLNTYTFVAKAVPVTTTGSFTLSETTASTFAESRDAIQVGATTIADDVTIIMIEYDVTATLNGEDVDLTVADPSAETIYTGEAQQFVVSTNLPAEVDCTITYTVNGEAVNAVALTEVGTYEVVYTITTADGYAEKTGTVTIEVKAPDFVVEAAKWTAVGKKLVLVYTNQDNMYFTYDGKLMIDVTSKGYKYENTTEYDHVFGFVTDDLANDVLDSYKAKVAYISEAEGLFILTDGYSKADVNFSETLNVQDISVEFGIVNLHSEIYGDVKYQKHLLKGDVNGDKYVNGKDTGFVVSEVKTAMGIN